jgi:hypothetical protein
MVHGFPDRLPRRVRDQIRNGVTIGSAGHALADEDYARSQLKSMSDYLGSQTSFSVDFDADLEVVTGEGQKRLLASSGALTVVRPDKLRATRIGGFANVEILFDGTTLTLLGKNANLYAQISAPGTIENLIDVLRDTYGRPLPAADLLLSNVYDVLMADVIDVKDLGAGVVDGAECDHFAFRNEVVDWQIWITQGDRPYPCRHVITSKDVAGGPQYSLTFSDWKSGGDVAPQDFAFANATNAQPIDVKDLAEASDLPAHFTIGAAQ